ncbi:MAG: (d)CMP kinase, partial [Planctomycetes bacterium]|nr:(d)CMP kinase [Planctomycetota bacterium]
VATWSVLRAGIPWDDRDAVAARIRDLGFRTDWQEDGLHVEAEGRDVTAEAFGPEVTREVHWIADDRAYRAIMLQWQRAYARDGVVAEGRDMGTVVFPEARWKFFLTASEDERAGRRWRELRGRGIDIPFETVKREMIERDRRDEGRAVSPLRPAGDARVIDTTARTIEEVVGLIEEAVGRDA